MKFKNKNILVLAPHTDDGELGAGGTLSKLAEISVADETVCRLVVNLHWSAIPIPILFIAPVVACKVSPELPKLKVVPDCGSILSTNNVAILYYR